MPQVIPAERRPVGLTYEGHELSGKEGMDNLQSRIREVQTMFQFSPLLTVARQLSIA